MNCEQVQSHLEEYIDKKEWVNPVLQESISSHLSTCTACAEEATVMRSLGDRIRHGLNAWVDDGVTPPLLAQRIVTQIRSAGHRPWWRSWPSTAGFAVAAAALLVALVGNQLDALPGMLGQPTFELHLSAATVPDQVTNRAVQVVEPKGSIQTSDHGVSLLLDKVELYSDSTRLTYRLTGLKVDRHSEPEAFQPDLTADGLVVGLQSFSATQTSAGVRFVARFGQVKPGQTLDLKIKRLPLPIAEPMEWLNAGVDLSGRAQITEWRQQGRRADLTVQWSEEYAHRLLEWSAADGSGKQYAVTESGPPVTVNGIRVQQLQIAVPQGVSPISIRVGALERNVSGLWQVSFNTQP